MTSKRFPYVVTLSERASQGEFIDRIAAEQDRSRGHILRKLIDEEINREEEQNQLLEFLK